LRDWYGLYIFVGGAEETEGGSHHYKYCEYNQKVAKEFAHGIYIKDYLIA
jgi:hypothetical protein